MLREVADFLTTPARQLRTLETVAHRPWPVPRRTWLMAQTWYDLLFAHWRVPPERLEPLVPNGLQVDTFDASGWLGITPFELTGLRLVATPPLPRVSTFLELNVRTYVTHAGKPGIWFFSLDAASAVAVAGARRLYRLPYFRAEMACRRTNGRIAYTSRRIEDRGEPAAFGATYQGDGAPSPAEPGSLEYFLAERYCLYTVFKGDLLRAEIHHPPWPLETAAGDIASNTMAPAAVGPLTGEPLFHYSARQDVVIWSLESAREAATTRRESAR